MGELIGALALFGGILGLLVLLWGASTIQDLTKEQDREIAEWKHQNIKYDPAEKDNPHSRRIE